MTTNTIPVLETWTWPWPIWTLHLAYLLSGLLIALHYIPQVRLAWARPEATRLAQSLVTWCVWTLCRAIAFIYGMYVVHDLVFLLVVGSDLLGRSVMVALIVRANLLHITRITEPVPVMAVAPVTCDASNTPLAGAQPLAVREQPMRRGARAGSS